MTHFTAYTAKLNPWFPNGFIPVVAWFVTAAETILAGTLFFGFQTRIAAQLNGWLLLAFAVGMTAGTGIKSALNASVFSASAGAFLLAAANAYPFSVDALRRKHRDAARGSINSQLKNTCTAPLVSNQLCLVILTPRRRRICVHSRLTWKNESSSSGLIAFAGEQRIDTPKKGAMYRLIVCPSLRCSYLTRQPRTNGEGRYSLLFW